MIINHHAYEAPRAVELVVLVPGQRVAGWQGQVLRQGIGTGIDAYERAAIGDEGTQGIHALQAEPADVFGHILAAIRVFLWLSLAHGFGRHMRHEDAIEAG